MRSLRGRVAFITGGTSGIGLGAVRVFAEAGMKVAFTYRNVAHVERAMAQLASVSVGQLMPVQLDVCNRAAYAAVAEEVESRLGPVDILFNNAGVNLFTPLDAVSLEDWDWVLGINLGGVINGIHTFVPRIRARGNGGHVIITGSMASVISAGGASIYTTSKFAVRGLAESLRHALAKDGIGVSLLLPGLTKSNIHEAALRRPCEQSDAARTANRMIAGEVGKMLSTGVEPEDVARSLLKGILSNQAYIFSHPGSRDEVAALNAELLAAVPEGPYNPPEVQIEEMRRQDRSAQEAIAKTIGWTLD
jgi:NAD(P)-dependent dehydrogenase (short-subunit alcohol dehydrogenase family)